MRGAMAELERDAYGQYNTFVQAALDDMKKNGVEPWSAPAEERAKLNQPQYAKAAFDSWFARAKEVGFDGPAYIAKCARRSGSPLSSGRSAKWAAPQAVARLLDRGRKAKDRTARDERHELPATASFASRRSRRRFGIA